MKKEDRALEAWKTLRWTYSIGAILDIPILVLLWWMKYKTGFWICLILFILGGIAAGVRCIQLEKLAGLNSK